MELKWGGYTWVARRQSADILLDYAIDSPVGRNMRSARFPFEVRVVTRDCGELLEHNSIQIATRL